MSWRHKLRNIKDRWVYRSHVEYASFANYKGEEWVALDLETTHLDAKQAYILSIGAVIIQAQTIKTSHSLDLKVKPQADMQEQGMQAEGMPTDAVKVHLLRKIDLQQGLAVEAAIAQLLEFVGNRPLVGYHIGYDLAVLEKWMRPQWGHGMPNKTIDVVNLYRQRLANKAVVESNMRLSFEDLAQQLNIPVINRHNALGDAITTALMFVKLSSPN